MPTDLHSTQAKPTLVLVPGLMCDQAVWSPVLPYLEPHAHCVVADHGRSDSLASMARRIVDSAPQRFCIAGHSMGARVALEVARMAPQRLRGLALLNSGYLPLAPGALGEQEVAKRMALLAIAQQQGVGVMAQQWAQQMVHPERLGDHAFMATIIGMFKRKSAAIFAQQLNALIHRPDATNVLKALAVPTLVMCARQDTWAHVAQHQAMASHAASASLSIVENAGHMAPMEQPVTVGEHLAHWLGKTA